MVMELFFRFGNSGSLGLWVLGPARYHLSLGFTPPRLSTDVWMCRFRLDTVQECLVDIHNGNVFLGFEKKN